MRTRWSRPSVPTVASPSATNPVQRMIRGAVRERHDRLVGDVHTTSRGRGRVPLLELQPGLEGHRRRWRCWCCPSTRRRHRGRSPRRRCARARQVVHGYRWIWRAVVPVVLKVESTRRSKPNGAAAAVPVMRGCDNVAARGRSGRAARPPSWSEGAPALAEDGTQPLRRAARRALSDGAARDRHVRLLAADRGASGHVAVGTGEATLDDAHPADERDAATLLHRAHRPGR